MSTILRALQKIEKETGAEEVGKPGRVHLLNASRTINRRLTTLWYMQLGKRFLLIGSGLATIGFIVFMSINFLLQTSTQKRPEHPSEQQRSLPHAVTPPPKETVELDNDMPLRGPTRPPAYAPKSSYDPEYRPNRYAGKSTENRVPQETIDRVEPPLETEMIAPEDMEEDLLSDESDIPSSEPEEPITILESDPEEVRYAQAEPLESKNLELQAISWSKTPAQRIAVINNEILRQGRIVSGYKVVYIGPETVVVEQGGKQWKMIFMTR